MAYWAFLRLPIVLEIGKYLFDLWNKSRTVRVLQGRNCYPGIWVGLLCRFCLTQLLVWFTKKKSPNIVAVFVIHLFVCINSWKRNLLVYISIILFLFFNLQWSQPAVLCFTLFVMYICLQRCQNNPHRSYSISSTVLLLTHYPPPGTLLQTFCISPWILHWMMYLFHVSCLQLYRDRCLKETKQKTNKLSARWCWALFLQKPARESVKPVCCLRCVHCCLNACICQVNEVKLHLLFNSLTFYIN